MSGIIYQYQQAYVPANGNTFYFWVDCSKEIYEEEAAEGGTVRLLYSEPAVSLADLVEHSANKDASQIIHLFDGVYDDRSRAWSLANDVWDTCHAAILRNIEEAG